jgi:release factor glutamine methyltransferase
VDSRDEAVAELVTLGLERREARWLAEEFMPGGDADALEAVRHAASRRLAGEPLQYVLGHWPFRTLDLDVDPRVLIPRPETEELVTHALAELAADGASAPMIVDLGSGSGAIGLALCAELRDRGVTASLLCVDESFEALAVARRNALKHRLLNSSFVQSDWFADLDPSLQGRIDLITANPPYVGEVEFADLDPVLGYEPYGALVAPDEGGVPGFEDVARILDEALFWLKPGGSLVMEHGDVHREAALERARRVGYVDVRDLDDLAGKPRVLVARRP